MELLKLITNFTCWEEYIKEQSLSVLTDQGILDGVEAHITYLENMKGPKIESLVDFYRTINVKNIHEHRENMIIIDDIYDTDEEKNDNSLIKKLSHYYRFSSNVNDKMTPFEYLKSEGDIMISQILTDVRGKLHDKTDCEILQYVRDNFHSLVVQMLHEQRLLVSTFPILRVFSVVHDLYTEARNIILNGNTRDDMTNAIKLCGCYDPFAGWGCRMMAFLMIKVSLLRAVISTGRYSNDDIDYFRNTEIYIGCDINSANRSLYDRIINLMSHDQFGITPLSAVIYHLDCKSSQGIELAIRYNRRFGITLSSPPTPWESYSKEKGDSTTDYYNESGNYNDWCNYFMSYVLNALVGYDNIIIYIDNNVKNGAKWRFNDLVLSNMKSNPLLFKNLINIGVAYGEQKLCNKNCNICKKNKCNVCKNCIKFNLCTESGCETCPMLRQPRRVIIAGNIGKKLRELLMPS